MYTWNEMIFFFFFVEVVQCELEKWFEYGWSDFCYKEKEKSLGCVLILGNLRSGRVMP